MLKNGLTLLSKMVTLPKLLLYLLLQSILVLTSIGMNRLLVLSLKLLQVVSRLRLPVLEPMQMLGQWLILLLIGLPLSKTPQTLKLNLEVSKSPKGLQQFLSRITKQFSSPKLKLSTVNTQVREDIVNTTKLDYTLKILIDLTLELVEMMILGEKPWDGLLGKATLSFNDETFTTIGLSFI